MAAIKQPAVSKEEIVDVRLKKSTALELYTALTIALSKGGPKKKKGSQTPGGK